MLKKIHALLVVFFALINMSCSEQDVITKSQQNYLSQHDSLSVAIYIAYPPYQFVNDQGNVDGILIDYLKVLEEKLNYTFKKKFYNNWKSLINDAKSGKIDVILEIQNTEDRRNYLIFTDPIFVGDHIIVSKEGNTINSIKELIGKKVAVGDGYSIQEYLKDNHPGLKLAPYTDEAESLKALSNGDVDAFIGLRSITNYTIKKQNLTNLEIQTPIYYKNELGIAINKQKPELAKIIKQANADISLEEKNKILDKWLYNIVTPIHKKFIFWKVLLQLVLLVLFLLFIFNGYLKRAVRNKTKELRAAKLRAEKSNNIKTLFLQNISHEVRTPLNSIMGFSSLLRQETPKENTPSEEYVNTILQESSKLTTILNNIIEISELTTAKTKPKLQQISINKELNILSDVYETKAKQKGLNFIFKNNISKTDSEILSDKSRLVKAINNILDNALKFTNEGAVTLSASLENKQLNITIEDTGIGINPKQSQVIFKEFYQEEKELSKKYDGLGIGLSIANENIKSLEGAITLNTTENKGSTFTITLPITTIPNKNSIISAPKTIESEIKILITEDMKLNYLVLAKTLDTIIEQKHCITWAKNGKEAVDIIKKESFDIIFMDIKMPILDGYEATKQIKKIKPEIPVIAQTAYAHEEDYNKAIDIGFDGYLTKPIDAKILKGVLKDFFVIQ